MAQEAKRGCGYRIVGGLYLVGDYILVPCDRLPLLLETCPICGHGIKLGQSFTETNPFKLWGNHKVCRDKHTCNCCQPPDDIAYIMRVGEKFYTPASFMQEAAGMGVSKRIPHIPRNLKVGKTVIYLAHKHAYEVRSIPEYQYSFEGEVNKQAEMPVGAEQVDKKLGVFCSFVPQRIEMPIWEKQAKDKEFMESLAKRGITPVILKYDKDHAPKGRESSEIERIKSGKS